ncbi:MAG: hypothetical protein ABSG04_00260 [Verrucomicrobiota bacterium]
MSHIEHYAKVAPRAEYITNSRKTNPMRKLIQTSLLIAAISVLTTAAHAQLVIAGDNFDADPLGSYGGVAWNFNGTVGNPQVMITFDNPEGTNTQNCAFTFDTSTGFVSGGMNLGWRTAWLTATGNTNASLSDYSLVFDLAVVGVDFGTLGGYEGITVGAVGNFGGIYYRENAYSNFPASGFPPAGTGYKHFAIPLTGFSKVGGSSTYTPTDTNFSFQIGIYVPNYTYFGIEEIDIANLALTMITNAPPPPPPTMTILPAKPGLRVFGQNAVQTYNQEGFGTVDENQSWVGVATPSKPVSYSIDIQDFDTVPGYTLYVQFLQNGGPVNPYIVYYGTNAFVWSITANPAGFTTAANWKTNAPTGNEVNNAFSMTTTSTNGRGTWTLTFTNDTNGTVTAPDGSRTNFVLDTNMTAQFVNPLDIMFGTAPNATTGFGQYIDISKIVITNVSGLNEYSDFTTNATFDTTQWTAAFSLDANSVYQVSTNTPLWVNWTVPDAGYGLGTVPSLRNASIPWYTPGYYSGVTITLTPVRMGTSKVWVLYPSACLPTVDGTPGGTPSPSAFFRLSNPPPTQ